MKQTYTRPFIISLLFLLTITAGCDDFLETNPSNEVSHELVFQTTELAQSLLDGTYRFLRKQDYLNQKSFDTRLDVIDGRDVMMNQSGFYNGDYDLSIDKTTQDLSEVADLWNFYYQIINHANNLVTYIDDAQGSDDEKHRIKGEALALRAYAYFNLINYFQHAWIKGSDLPGVPIYTQPANNKTVGNPRGTVADVYNRIITDLEDALSLLPADGTRQNKGYVNKNVAHGLLARAYLFKTEFDKAALHAKEARLGYPLMAQEEYVKGFNDYSNSEWIWGLPFNSEEILVNSSFFSDYDLERPSSSWSIRINNQFYALFSETDCRAKFQVGANPPLIIYKNRDPVNQAISSTDIKDSLVTRKFRDKADLTGNYVMMRSAEMILIEAEAEAELSHFEAAQNLLFQVQSRADKQAVKSTATGQQLIDEILIERRKELYGEGLASVFDLKRRNLPLERSGNQLHGGFEAGSNRLVWQIPSKEIDANQNISESEQNPR